MKKIFSFLLIALTMMSCAKEESLSDSFILGLGGEDYTWNEIDEWIYDNITKPYNMEVKYRWDQSELDLNRTLVPVEEDKVIPVMETILTTWISVYEEVGGADFIKSLSPKKFVLVGSPEYNNSTITLGEAEGGRKITIYRINWFEQSDIDIIQSIMKTVHHEFGHTMHQTVNYTTAFDEITATTYNSSWNNVSSDEAMQKGYVSAYASANADEDFVETLSRILVYGKDWFDEYVQEASDYYETTAANELETTYDPAEALLAKEAIVEAYLYDVWGIYMYDQEDGTKGLETLVQEAIANVVAAVATKSSATSYFSGAFDDYQGVCSCSSCVELRAKNSKEQYKFQKLIL